MKSNRIQQKGAIFLLKPFLPTGTSTGWKYSNSFENFGLANFHLCSFRKYSYYLTEEIGISWGWEKVCKNKKIKKSKEKLIGIFRGVGGGGGVIGKTVPWGRFGYFLKQHLFSILFPGYFE